MKLSDQIKSSQLKRPNPHPSNGSRHEDSRQSQRGSGDGLRSEVTAGLANTLTHQVQTTLQHIQAAEEFTDRAAAVAAQKAHKLASGQAFSEKFVGELNRLCAERPFDGFGSFDWKEANSLLDELGKPALPAQRPNFLPGA